MKFFKLDVLPLTSSAIFLASSADLPAAPLTLADIDDEDEDEDPGFMILSSGAAGVPFVVAAELQASGTIKSDIRLRSTLLTCSHD
jgi:hypothetical protein